jgi:uncharacterized protein involved in outer membrane biogenesis
MDIDMSTSGNTDEEISRSLSGTATLAMPDGGQVAFNLGSLIAAAQAGGLGWDKVADGSTSVDKLDAKLQAANGVLTATSVEAETETRKVQVGGTVDLSKQVVDLSIASSPKDGVTAARERVRIRGPLLAPAIRTDPPSKAALNVPH